MKILSVAFLLSTLKGQPPVYLVFGLTEPYWNRSQQAYYLENGTFGSSIDQLGIGIKTQTENYKYDVSTASSQISNNGNSLKPALKSYVGNVVLSTLDNASSDATTLAVLCETNAVGAVSTDPTPSGSGTILQPSCPINYSQLSSK